jgi:hypothetical protein
LIIVLSGVALFAASTSIARATDECIVKPNADPPSGQHWYYRTDRQSNRQCWYLGPQDAAMRTTATRALKDIKPAEDATNMSQQQREALFRKFIEWQHNHAAQGAQ